MGRLQPQAAGEADGKDGKETEEEGLVTQSTGGSVLQMEHPVHPS